MCQWFRNRKHSVISRIYANIQEIPTISENNCLKNQDKNAIFRSMLL